MKGRVVMACVILSATAFAAGNGTMRFDPGKIELDAPTVRDKTRLNRLRIILAANHSGKFISPEIFDCADEAACEGKGVDYYKRIGVLDTNGNPTPTRGTMQAWLKTNGFSADPTHPGADELRAVYYNRADLGFGRDMHCRSSRLSLLHLFKTACYVSNFGDNAGKAPNGNEQGSIGNAIANNHPIATVAMETTRGGGFGRGEVRFFVYDTSASQPGKLTGKALTAAILDSEGPKANPGVCMNCHGGTSRYDDDGNPVGTFVDDANFLPFDAQQFGYHCPRLVILNTNRGAAPRRRAPLNAQLCGRSSFTEAVQRETFRKLNALVKDSVPAAPTIAAQIDDWYAWCGGVGTANCAIDDAGHPSTPAGWKSVNASAGATTTTFGGASKPVNNAQIIGVYQKVARVYCRTCHLARRSDYDVQNVAKANKIRIKLDPAGGSSNMPNAERPFNDYWNSAAAKAIYATAWP